MSKDLNQCNFIGRLGKDVETRYMPSGEAVTSFSIACSDDYKSKSSGDKVERTNWISIVIFGKLAEIAEKYLKKGSQVFISGKQVTEKYTDNQGIERYSTKIIADTMQMLGGKSDSGQVDNSEPENMTPTNNPPVDDNFDDDIPF